MSVVENVDEWCERVCVCERTLNQFENEGIKDIVEPFDVSPKDHISRKPNQTVLISNAVYTSGRNDPTTDFKHESPLGRVDD